MDILCAGLNHRTAPVGVRERFAVPEGSMAGVASELAHLEGIGEAVVVSTCNRVEYYVAAADPMTGLETLRGFIEERSGLPLGDSFIRRGGAESVRHLFRVVSGLDSMVLGETEILGQVKKAYLASQTGGTTSRYLNKLFQRAFNVAKEVRTKTNIQRGSVSVGSVAVDLAEKIFGKLGRCKVMILGAGEMSELTAGALQARGVKTIFVANRSYDRAVYLAEKMNGRAIHFEEWTQNFHDVDILIGSTAAPHHVVTRDMLETVMRTRCDRPLFCIDLAVPRDFEPEVNEIDGVYLYDIDHLQRVAQNSMENRRQELAVCEEIIDRHVVEFTAWVEGSFQNALAYSAAASGAEPRPVRS
jgi:glutamyl-tRNA reductase